MEIIEMRPRRSALTINVPGIGIAFAPDVLKLYVVLLSVISSLFQYKKVLC